MITAEGKSWNSPTTLYIARRIEALGRRGLTVLDLGCGRGTVLEHLLGSGHDLYGCDMASELAAARKALTPHFGVATAVHLREVTDESRVPFDDSSFDVIYANQVFEHLRDLDAVLGECARVLKPDGLLLATFPPSSSPLEVHIGLPFAHWLPPGRARIRFIQLLCRLGLKPVRREETTKRTAEVLDAYLREQTFYRTTGSIIAAVENYFGRTACETSQLLEAKLDMLRASRQSSLLVSAALETGPLGRFLVTRLVIAAYSFSAPFKRRRKIAD